MFGREASSFCAFADFAGSNTGAHTSPVVAKISFLFIVVYRLVAKLQYY